VVVVGRSCGRRMESTQTTQGIGHLTSVARRRVRMRRRRRRRRMMTLSATMMRRMRMGARRAVEARRGEKKTHKISNRKRSMNEVCVLTSA
jgi:hypothetical protein